MRHLLFYILLFNLVFVSCTSSLPQIQSIVKNENTRASIRSFVLQEEGIVLPNQNGNIYLLNNTNTLDSIQIKTASKGPNFRSSAQTETAVFVLSIENPALLYKISKNELWTGQPKYQKVYEESNPVVFYDAMAFYDNLNGIAIGDPTGNCMSVIHTKDGGESWAKIPCDKLPSSIDGEAAFAASNTNITIYNNTVWFVSGGKVSRVYKSDDYGNSWEVFDTPMVNGKNSTGAYTMDFYNDKIGIICGGDYTQKQNNTATKAISYNGGETWDLIANNTIPGYISCVQFIPNGKGKLVSAVSTEGIYFSKDTGKTWKKVHQEGYYKIEWINSKEAVLSGNNKVARLKLQ